MNREFLELYNSELQYLSDAATAFAQEYPGVAERLGGLYEDQADPAIRGLLEGAAFLAARVQLKLKHEFPEFTANFLDLLLPTYLAPIPSTLIAAVEAPFDDPNLKKGIRIARGSQLDASFLERETRISCRYTLISEIELWPIDIAGAEYLPGPGAIHSLGVSAGPDIVAALKLDLVHRGPGRDGQGAGPGEAEDPGSHLSALPIRQLPIFLAGPLADRCALYEQLFGHCTRVFVCFSDAFGGNRSFEVPRSHIEQIGFAPHEHLIDREFRMFDGFQLLWDYFVCRDRFLGFRLTGLSSILDKLHRSSASLVFCFNEANSRLASVLKRENFSLYSAPAINLFHKSLDRIPLQSNQHEYHVIPDRSNYLNYEPYMLRRVYAHYQGSGSKVPVLPLYSAPATRSATDAAPLVYTTRRVPRRRNAAERRFGSTSSYIGTDMFLSLYDPATIDDADPAVELSVSALCSNRHLTEHLPVGEGGADFRLVDNVALQVTCVAGPTPPQEPIVSYHKDKSGPHWSGSVAWRLINFLAVNQLGLTGRAGGRDAAALKEVLALFPEGHSKAAQNAQRGLKSIDARPVVRRISRSDGTGIGRGLEITVTIDENAFDGSEAFLFGAILERFLSEYASVNTFTQTVISSTRGVLMVWPPRTGARSIL